jgi:PAS domain S-box-containing protein
MSDKVIHVLAIEDNLSDAALLQDKLAEAQCTSWGLPCFAVEHVTRVQAALDRLRKGGIDVVLSDLDLPDSRVDETIATLREQIPELPIVVLTGREDEALAHESVRAGVQDYLYKSEATGSLLARTMMYAIERQKNSSMLQEARDILEQRVDDRMAELRHLNAELRSEIDERKRMEAALRESEARYRSLFRDYPISIWEEDFSAVKAYLDELRASGVTDFAAYFEENPEAVAHCVDLVRIIDVNKAALKLRGAESKADFSGGLGQFLSEESYAGFAEELIHIADGETRFEVDAVDRTAEGERRYLVVTWKVASGYEETLSRCLVSIRDITERKWVERALQESESRMRSIFRAAPIGIGLVSDRQLLDVNDRLCEMVGYTRDELVGKDARLLYPTDEDYNFVGREKYRQITKQGTGTVETRFKHKDGRIIDVLLSSTPLDLTDLSIGVTFTALDITERKRAEEALRKSEEQFRMTIQRAPIGVGIVDSEGDLIDCNTALADMLGYSRENLLDMSFADFTHPEDLERELQLIDDLWREKSVQYRMEKRYIRKDGHTIWVNIAASLFKGDTGESGFGFAFVQDITARKRAEKAIRLNQRRTVALLELSRMRDASFEQIADFVLDKAVFLTGSEIGFLGFMAEDEEEMTLHTWSERAMRDCRTDDKPRHFLVKEAGVWAEAVRQRKPLILNDYVEPSLHKKGYPEGHVALNRLLSIPVCEGDAIAAVVAVANKDVDYDEADVRQLQLLTDGMLRLMREQRAEEALRDSEARYRYIFQTAGVPIWEEDFSDIKAAIDALNVTDFRQYLDDHPEFVAEAAQMIKIRDVNAATLQMLGAEEKEDVLGSLDEIFVPETLEIFRRELIALAEGQTYFEGETVNQTLQGERRHILLTMAIPPQAETLDSVLISTMDITERKRMEEALQESERQKDLILNATAEMVAYYDTDLSIIWANRAAAESVGKTPEEMVGLHCYEIWHRRETPCVGCPLLAARDAKAPQQGERQTPDGQFWSVRGFPVFDEEEKVVALIEFGQDITERKIREEEIERYAAELERSNQELQQFAYVASHDLQAPLRTLMGFLRLMEAADIDLEDAQASRYVDYALESAARMQGMIKALLDLSRVETRGADFAPTDCGALVQHILEMLAPAIEESGAVVTCEPLPTVMADQAQLAQVFQNLITNAIKFRREDVVPRVDISARRGEDAWVFSVDDNGIGIESEQTERIFQIFQRLHTEDEYPGLGMGLALCKRIVERHGGRIWVDSEPGEGAAFSFTIPIRREVT